MPEIFSEDRRTGGLFVATSPIPDEWSALERARARLEVALSGDENWRALTQSDGEGDSSETTAARLARNTRLEMALAQNVHYQAWKHVKGAIDALRAQIAEPRDLPAPAGNAARASVELPDDVAALLQGEEREAKPRDAQSPPDPSPSARTRLVERLGRLEGGAPDRAVEPAAGPVAARGSGVERRARKQMAAPRTADPPEATVTFVIRESRTPLPPSAELSPDLPNEPNSPLFERVRSSDETAALSTSTFSSSKDGSEEAEVTIFTEERLRQQREAEERDNIVRRFRKALSGD
jgi:hypothetical protein